VIAYRKDCSSAPMLKFFYGPQDFRMGADLYQKLPFLAIFGSVSPHFLSHNGKIWCEGADLRVPSECQILFKKIYPFGENLCQNSHFFEFGALSLHF